MCSTTAATPSKSFRRGRKGRGKTMDLYIGNATKQEQQFCYRVPEDGRLRVQDIHVGTQIKVSGELTAQQIDAIVDQHRMYGLIPAAEAGKVKDFAGLCYSVGKPIQIDKLQLAI